jgi:tetratricopeptide (TPR) repeat protein/transglutaminase-like putative cysteine protease
MRRIIPGLLALAWTAAACAAGRLEFAPPPPWVKPVPLPVAVAATHAPVRILLIDRQLELAPGTVKMYVESAFRIQTPQGLSQIGTLTLTWDPDTDAIIVHHVRILRGHEAIDVLASGQKFTVARRETNLAYASLDDVLTAILQPTDLRVGDILDVAYTIERTDPILAGTAEANVAISPALPIAELHISARWPASFPVAWRAAAGITGLREVHEGADDGVEVDMRHVQPILQPTGAPPRYLIERRIQFSSFGSWAQVAQRLAPLYAKAARLAAGSPLEAQIARIRSASADPRARAALALALVENKVRYVFLGMGDDGLVPAGADLTWSRRFGDCKGKTVLLLALLRGLGIEAEPVAVSAVHGFGLDELLPGVQPFDHVLVRAVIGGETYWLDGTRMGDRSLANLTVPFFHWALPLVASGATLTRLVPPPAATPMVATSVRIDATGGIARPAPFHVQADFHGDIGILMHLRFANLTQAQLDVGLRALWRQQFDDVDVGSVAARYHARTATESLTMDGTAHLDWSGGQLAPPELGIGYRADFTRHGGPERDAPFAVPYPSYVEHTVVIDLPGGGAGFSISGSDVERTVAGVEYRRQAKIAAGVFTGVASRRSIATEFPASEAAADQKALRAMAKDALDIDAPTGHAPSALERKWGVAKTGSSAAEFVSSGDTLLDHAEYGPAIVDFDTALEYDARNAVAIADRGSAYEREGHFALAARDFAAALALDPKNSEAWNGSGWLALVKGRNAEAIADFEAALHASPKDEFALENLAAAFWRTGRLKKALTSLDAALRLSPRDVSLYGDRATLLRVQGRNAAALREARRVVAANAGNPYAYLLAGLIDAAQHRHAQARAAFAHAIALAPTATTYLQIAALRPWSDLAGRRADIEKALSLDPASGAAIQMLADVQMAAGHDRQAVSTLTSALEKYGDSEVMRVERGIAYERSGRARLAQRDFDAAQRRLKTAAGFDHMCWQLATADVELKRALADCDTALRKAPDNFTILNSRGFVLLRLGHCRQAIAAYDAALKLDSIAALPLYGRGICELRDGNTRRGRADIREASELSFRTGDLFAHYGVRPPEGRTANHTAG